MGILEFTHHSSKRFDKDFGKDDNSHGRGRPLFLKEVKGGRSF